MVPGKRHTRGMKNGGSRRYAKHPPLSTVYHRPVCWRTIAPHQNMILCVTYISKMQQYACIYEGRSEINASYFIMLAHDVRGEYC